MTGAKAEFIDDTATDFLALSKENPKTLYPTRECFDDSLGYMVKLLEKTDLGEVRKATLVHGYLRFSDRDSLHGWVEHRGDVVDCKFFQGERVYVAVDRSEFYETFRIVDTKRYSFEQALGENLTHGHHGPWEPRYYDALNAAPPPGDVAP